MPVRSRCVDQLGSGSSGAARAIALASPSSGVGDARATAGLAEGSLGGVWACNRRRPVWPLGLSMTDAAAASLSGGRGYRLVPLSHLPRGAVAQGRMGSHGVVAVDPGRDHPPGVL